MSTVNDVHCYSKVEFWIIPQATPTMVQVMLDGYRFYLLYAASSMLQTWLDFSPNEFSFDGFVPHRDTNFRQFSPAWIWQVKSVIFNIGYVFRSHLTGESLTHYMCTMLDILISYQCVRDFDEVSFLPSSMGSHLRTDEVFLMYDLAEYFCIDRSGCIICIS